MRYNDNEVQSNSGCVVWWADLSMLRPQHLKLLGENERTRYFALRREEDRKRFAVGAVLLRSAVAQIVDVASEQVLVDRRCPTCMRQHGRPSLPGTGIHASVSHSGSRVAVAITEAAPVGIDVEAIVGNDLHKLASRVLADDEIALDQEAFFVYWTRKEAAVKATGDGLAVPLYQVLVSQQDEPARLREYPGQIQWQMSLVDLTPGRNYAAALAILRADLVRRGSPAQEVLRTHRDR